MKSLLFMLALCLWASSAFGQSISFHSGNKSGKKLPTQKLTHMLPSDTEGQLLVVEYELNATGVVKGVRVRQINEEWKESASVKIDDTRRNSTEQAFRTGDRIHLLLSSADDDYYRMRHVVVSVAGLQVVSDSLLLDVKLAKGEVCYSWTALSPEKSRVAVVHTVWNNNSKQSTASAMLFDGDMKKQWGQPLWYGDIQQMLVTDRGEVVTACLLSSKDHQETLLRMNAADASGRKQDEVVLKGDLEQVSLLNYTGGKLLCTALEGDGGHGLIGKRKFTAFHVCLYDMNASTLRLDTRHAFSAEELCVFENVDTDTRLSSKSTNYIQRIEQETTPGGGAVIYQRTWKEITRQNGIDVSETIHRKGMLLANIDTLGNLLWVRAIMQNNQNVSKVELSADLVVCDGKLYVFTNEAKDETNEYTPHLAAKRSKSLLMANAALAVYHFTADGRGAKQMLATDDKFIFHSPMFDFGGGNYYLLAGGMGPKVCHITIP